MIRRYHSLTLLLLLIISGCSTIPKDVERPVSHALKETEDTKLSDLFASEEEEHAGLSGFVLIDRGKVALDSRMALVDLAEKSIDIQTYLWRTDTSSRLLTKRLLDAADRGVRIRILLDDFLLRDRDFGLTVFDAHPNVSIRVFNPFGNRLYIGPINLRRKFELVTDLSRLNYRMHNKVFIVDNQAGIVGGRNIGDEYFGYNQKYNFFDLDLLATGPVVNDLSYGFDDYWNSEWVYPITVFKDHPPTEKLPGLYDNFRKSVEDLRIKLDQKRNHDKFKVLQELSDKFVWADSEVIVDNPDKADGTDINRVGVYESLRDSALGSDSEVLIVSPYFIPGPNAGDALSEYDKRGVSVKVLTNSLASTNQVAAFSGYARYRKDVIESATKLYEFRTDASEFVYEEDIPHSSEKSGLHAKMMTFDRERVFVGSFNLDPRSINLNTEIGLLVYSEELADQVAELIDELILEENSWQVVLDDNGNLVWLGTKNGEKIEYNHDPEASGWRRFNNFIYSLLPIEQHL
jgi:cardiolipin synthase C